jgi:hypothetical protein
MSRAAKLHITQGPVWILGTSDEERALLDPLPEGVEIVLDRDMSVGEDEDASNFQSQPVSAAVIVVDSMETTPELLDDTLPRVGSVSLVWVVVPAEVNSSDVTHIEAMASEYGWSAIERVELDDGWSAVRLDQA